MTALEQLLQISTPSLIAGPLPDAMPMLAAHGALGAELDELLRTRNGFYAFESALHVFPWGSAEGVISLGLWNSPGLWRDEYGTANQDLLFFAEDAFGVQFCLHADGVFMFDPETGERSPMGSTLEEWAGLVLVDHRTTTGWPLLHAWQVAHGALRPGRRLAPKTPFVLGGAFDLGNLYDADPVERMRFCASLARQIHDLPDGAKVQLVVKD